MYTVVVGIRIPLVAKSMFISLSVIVCGCIYVCVNAKLECMLSVYTLYGELL